jgi:hypothetical protein
MRTKVSLSLPVMLLGRVLDALGQELLEASDEEIIEAARSLGMRPEMQGSAAFAGLRYGFRPQWSDFFDVEMGHLLPGTRKNLPHK